MPKALQLLIVEDNPADAELAVLELTRAGFAPQWLRVENEPDFLAALKKRPDIILSDFSLPQFSGMRALELLQASGLDIPLILISGTVGEDVAVEAMRQGAVDYLLKDRTARLGSAVERALQEKRFRTERRRAEEALCKSEMRLRSIIETEPECVKVVSREGRLLEMNPAGLAMLQVESVAAVQQHTLLAFILPEYQAAFRNLHRRVMEGQSGKLEFEIVGLKGRRLWLETHATPLHNAAGAVEGLLGVTRDTTDRHQAAEKINAQLLELQRWRETTLGREDRVQALKKEVNELLQQAGQPPRYAAVEK